MDEETTGTAPVEAPQEEEGVFNNIPGLGRMGTGRAILQMFAVQQWIRHQLHRLQIPQRTSWYLQWGPPQRFLLPEE